MDKNQSTDQTFDQSVGLSVINLFSEFLVFPPGSEVGSITLKGRSIVARPVCNKLKLIDLPIKLYQEFWNRMNCRSLQAMVQD